MRAAKEKSVIRILGLQDTPSLGLLRSSLRHAWSPVSFEALPGALYLEDSVPCCPSRFLLSISSSFPQPGRPNVYACLFVTCPSIIYCASSDILQKRLGLKIRSANTCGIKMSDKQTTFQSSVATNWFAVCLRCFPTYWVSSMETVLRESSDVKIFCN